MEIRHCRKVVKIQQALFSCMHLTRRFSKIPTSCTSVFYLSVYHQLFPIVFPSDHTSIHLCRMFIIRWQRILFGFSRHSWLTILPRHHDGAAYTKHYKPVSRPWLNFSPAAIHPLSSMCTSRESFFSQEFVYSPPINCTWILLPFVVVTYDHTRRVCTGYLRDKPLPKLPGKATWSWRNSIVWAMYAFEGARFRSNLTV